MMKFKNLTAKAAVVALALSAALPASAALTNTAGGNSSLMLTVWNSTISYTRNLGTTLTGFLTSYGNVAGNTFAGDSVFTSAFPTSSTDPLNWNIVAGDASFGNNVNPVQLLITGPLADSGTAINRVAINSANVTIDNQVAAMNGVTGCSTGNSCTVAHGSTGDGAAAGWSNLGGQAPYETIGTTASAQLGMYLIGQSSPIANNLGTVTQFSVNGQQSYWTLNAATGAVTWNVASVPVPAAVWLLGSGLLGLIGVGRRKAVVAA